jgi:RNA polymerase sigma factor (sigma-70 family)
MFNDRGPHYSAKCPFYIEPNNPLSAETSIHRCVRCATCGHHRLQAERDDFRQIAYLTILEDEPKYDPAHESGASFITFMKSRVCGRLWSQRRKVLKYTPFSMDPPSEPDARPNPLVAALTAEACASKSLEDEVCEKIEVEALRSFLPQVLDRLSKKERHVIELKYFKDASGRDIAKHLRVSEGRVSQLLKSALGKLRKAYMKMGGESSETVSFSAR